jgi:hypothetical protein
VCFADLWVSSDSRRYYRLRRFISGRAFQIRASQQFAAIFYRLWRFISRRVLRRFVGYSDLRRYYRLCRFLSGRVLCRFMDHSQSRRDYPSRVIISGLVSRPSKVPLLVTYPRQALAALLLEGVHFRVCFADSWVAESAHSVSRRYYPLIGRIPGVPLKALERLTSCLSGGNLLRVLLVCRPFYRTAFIA